MDVDDNGEMLLLLSTIATNQLMSSRVLCVSTSVAAALSLATDRGGGGVLNFCFSEYHHHQQAASHTRCDTREKDITVVVVAGRPHADEM